MSETNFPKHVFWLGKFDRTSFGYLSRPRFCTVSAKAIAFDTNFERVAIPLKQVASCKLYVIRYAKRPDEEFVNIKLHPEETTLDNYSQPSQYFLAVANPLTLEARYFYDETRLMVDVINAYLNQQPITAHPNPYYREFERLNKLDYFVEEEWDAVVSPNEYTYRKLPRKLRQRHELDNQLANQFMLWVMAMWLLAIGVITTFMGYWIPTGFMAFLIVMLVLMLGITHWQSRRLTPARLREIAELDRQRV